MRPKRAARNRLLALSLVLRRLRVVVWAMLVRLLLAAKAMRVPKSKPCAPLVSLSQTAQPHLAKLFLKLSDKVDIGMARHRMIDKFTQAGPSWARALATFATMACLAAPTLAETDPIGDVFSSCDNHEIFMNFRVDEFERQGWTQRRGGLSATEADLFAQLFLVVETGNNTDQEFLSETYAMLLSNFTKVESFPDGMISPVRILDKTQGHPFTLLIIDRDPLLFCAVAARRSTGGDGFVDAFTGIAAKETNLLATSVNSFSKWYEYNSTYSARSQFYAIEPKTKIIATIAGRPVEPAYGLVTITEIQKQN